jgi:hypothetical protein
MLAGFTSVGLFYPCLLPLQTPIISICSCYFFQESFGPSFNIRWRLVTNGHPASNQELTKGSPPFSEATVREESIFASPGFWGGCSGEVELGTSVPRRSPYRRAHGGAAAIR